VKIEGFNELGLPWRILCQLACRSHLTHESMDMLVYNTRMEYMKWVEQELLRRSPPVPKPKQYEKETRRRSKNER
jgi:hypothetical protein